MALPSFQVALGSFNVLFTYAEKIDMRVRSKKDLEPLAQIGKEECNAARKLVDSLQVNIGLNHIGDVVVQDTLLKLKNAVSKSKEMSRLWRRRVAGFFEPHH